MRVLAVADPCRLRLDQRRPGGDFDRGFNRTDLEAYIDAAQILRDELNVPGDELLEPVEPDVELVLSLAQLAERVETDLVRCRRVRVVARQMPGFHDGARDHAADAVGHVPGDRGERRLAAHRRRRNDHEKHAERETAVDGHEGPRVAGILSEYQLEVGTPSRYAAPACGQP